MNQVDVEDSLPRSPIAIHCTVYLTEYITLSLCVCVYVYLRIDMPYTCLRSEIIVYIIIHQIKKKTESKNNYPLAVIGFKASVPCLAKSVSGLMTLSSPIMFAVLKQSFVCNISAWCSPFRLSRHCRIQGRTFKFIKAMDLIHIITMVHHG